MLLQCWACVVDGGSILEQRWGNVSCLLDYCLSDYTINTYTSDVYRLTKPGKKTWTEIKGLVGEYNHTLLLSIYVCIKCTIRELPKTGEGGGGCKIHFCQIMFRPIFVFAIRYWRQLNYEFCFYKIFHTPPPPTVLFRTPLFYSRPRDWQNAQNEEPRNRTQAVWTCK